MRKKIRMFVGFLLTFGILMMERPLSKYFNEVCILIVQIILLWGVFTFVIPKKSK